MAQLDRPRDVWSSLAELRAFAHRGSSGVEELSTVREVAARRLAARSVSWRETSTELVDELLARDEELAAATEELREQVEALSSAAELLERERAKYADLFAFAPEAYILTDLAGLTQEANRAAGTLFGVEPRFLVGKRLITFVSRQDTRAFRLFLKEVAGEQDGGGTARPFTLRMRPRGQAVFVASGRASTVRTASARPFALRWILRRVDPDARESGERLAQDAVARMLTDDLCGPTAIICAWSQLLQSGQVEDPDERALALEWIRRSAEIQRATLEGLAELCDAGEAHETERDGTVDVWDVVSSEIAAMRGARGEGCVPPDIVTERDGAEPRARGDAKRLRRVIGLLLRRCVDGTPLDGPAIRLRLSTADGHVVFDIEAPEGAAIPSGWAARVAIASRLLEREGGRLVANGDKPSCRLWLPATLASAAPAP